MKPEQHEATEGSESDTNVLLWRDISSAPLEQEEIILFDPTNKPTVFTGMAIGGEWVATAEGRYAPEDDYFGDPDKEPTHWMPKPSEP